MDEDSVLGGAGEVWMGGAFRSKEGIGECTMQGCK